MQLDANDKLQTLHQDPRGEADLDEVVVDPGTLQPMAASYRSTVAATYGIGDAQGVVADIAKRFPGRDIGLQVASGPAARWLVTERASTLRDPRWWLYDPRTGNLRRILDDPGITANVPEENAMARKIAIDYLASDGMRVRGFLLLPPGVDAAHAPLIAHVHGGPINHFRPGYDGVAQFLANRGYVVFQSNFRGSTGHGRAYTFASNGDYGNGRVQQDIVEGVRWLLAQGIGDKDRVGIVGIGGLGHMGVKLAHAMGAHTVAFTTSESKRQDALDLGADEVVVSRNAEEMAKHAGSFDFILNTVAASHDLDAFTALLKRDGTLCLVGVPEHPHPTPNVGALIFRRRSIAGSLIGGIAETQEMLDFCAEHGIVADIEMIDIQQIDDAYDRMQRSDVKYRFVIDNASLARA